MGPSRAWRWISSAGPPGEDRQNRAKERRSFVGLSCRRAPFGKFRGLVPVFVIDESVFGSRGGIHLAEQADQRKRGRRGCRSSDSFSAEKPSSPRGVSAILCKRLP